MRINTERDAEVVARYIGGESISHICRRFRITRSRLYQILDAAKVPRERQSERLDRNRFLGVNLSEPVKDALRAEAERRGISMSALSSDVLKEMLIACGYLLEAERIS